MTRSSYPLMRRIVWSEYIAVGAGKRLFEGANAPVVLKLVDTQSFDSGVVALTYDAAD